MRLYLVYYNPETDKLKTMCWAHTKDPQIGYGFLEAKHKLGKLGCIVLGVL
jgi:hypothetical protein